ncbi:MAG: HAD family hydrolase [Rhodospirillaceae bacterium]|nr:HAD family hydrolase [Rhodospirillaceae bacterium]
MIDISSPPAGAVFKDGIFTQVLAPPNGHTKRPALFLDRDGVVVAESHYLYRVEDVALIPGAAETIAKANKRGIPVVFVTNQAGIGYGYFEWQSFYAVQDKILTELTAAGAHIDGVYACPFHVKGKPPYDHPDHPARKPNPGMLLFAGEDLSIDLNSSWIIGDRAGDIEAGLNAGLAGGIHVLTGHGSIDGERDDALALASKSFKALAAPSIAEASDLIDLLID